MRILVALFAACLTILPVAVLPGDRMTLIAPQAVLTCIAAIPAFFICVVERRRWVAFAKTRLGMLWLLFFAIVLVSPLWSIDVQTSIYGNAPRYVGVVTLASAMIVGTAAAILWQTAHRRILVQALVTATSLLLAFGFLQLAEIDPLGIWPKDRFLGRIASTLGHPTILPQVLLLLAPLALAAANARWKIFLGVACATCLIATGSVIGVGAALLAAVVTLTAGRMWTRAGMQIVVTSLVFGAMLGGSALMTRVDKADIQRSVSARSFLWESGLRAIAERPYGSGLSSTQIIYDGLIPQEIEAFEGPDAYADRWHSIVLETGSTLGLQGLIVMLAFVIVLMTGLLRKLRAAKDPITTAAFASLLGGGLSMALHPDTIAVIVLACVVCGIGMAILQPKIDSRF